MQTERRKSSRIRPATVCYLEFANDFGGMTWNISETGLGFQSVVPLRKSAELEFCLSPNPNQKIGLRGTIVWTDESGKFGGLRFAEMPLAAAAEFASWLKEFREQNDSRAREMTEDLPAMPAIAGTAISIDFPGVPGIEFSRPKESVPAASKNSERKTQSPSSALIALSPPAFQGQFRPLANYPWPETSRKAAGTTNRPALTFGVLAILALLVAYRIPMGNLLVGWGGRLVGDQSASRRSIEYQPAKGFPAAQTQPGVEVGATSEYDGDAKSGDATDLAAAVPYREDQPQAAEPTSAAAGKQKEADEPRSVTEVGQKATIKSLWAAIQTGSVPAEVALADRYLKGDGVSRNCEQARVLLRAASRRGSITAKNMLQRKTVLGCR